MDAAASGEDGLRKLDMVDAQAQHRQQQQQQSTTTPSSSFTSPPFSSHESMRRRSRSLSDSKGDDGGNGVGEEAQSDGRRSTRSASMAAVRRPGPVSVSPLVHTGRTLNGSAAAGDTGLSSKDPKGASPAAAAIAAVAAAAATAKATITSSLPSSPFRTVESPESLSLPATSAAATAAAKPGATSSSSAPVTPAQHRNGVPSPLTAQYRHDPQHGDISEPPAMATTTTSAAAIPASTTPTTTASSSAVFETEDSASLESGSRPGSGLSGRSEQSYYGGERAPTRIRRGSAKAQRRLHKLFRHLPGDEVLLADYSCAIQREILVHGRMYITPVRICFHSNIFGWETVVEVCLSDIVAMTKEKTALVIPNAIQIRTRESKHLFASFMHRDQSFRLLFSVWQSALLGGGIPAEFLAATAGPQAGTMYNSKTSSALQYDVARSGSGSDGNGGGGGGGGGRGDDIAQKRGGTAPASLSRMAADYAAATARSSRHAGSGLARGISAHGGGGSGSGHRHRRSLSQAGDPYLSPVDAASTTGTSHDSSRSSGSETPLSDGNTEEAYGDRIGSVSGVRHRRKASASAVNGIPLHAYPVELSVLAEDKGRVFVDQSYPCSTEFVAACLLARDDNFFEELFRIQGTTDPVDKGWRTPSDDHGTLAVGMIRAREYTVGINFSLGPKSARTYEEQCVLHADPGLSYIIEGTVHTPSVPYGDSFRTRTRMYISAESARSTHLLIRAEVVYPLGKPWALTRSLIEKNAYKGISIYWGQAKQLLAVFCANEDAVRVFERPPCDNTGRRRSRAVEGPYLSNLLRRLPNSSKRGGGDDGPGGGGRGHRRQHSNVSYASITAATLSEANEEDGLSRNAASRVIGGGARRDIVGSVGYFENLTTNIRTAAVVLVIALLASWNVYLLGKLASLEAEMAGGAGAASTTTATWTGSGLPPVSPPPPGPLDAGEALEQAQQAMLALQELTRSLAQKAKQ